MNSKSVNSKSVNSKSMKTQNDYFLSIGKRYLQQLKVDLLFPDELVEAIVTYLPMRSYYEKLLSKSVSLKKVSFTNTYCENVIQMHNGQTYCVYTWYTSRIINILMHTKEWQVYFTYDYTFQLEEFKVFKKLVTIQVVNFYFRNVGANWKFIDDKDKPILLIGTVNIMPEIPFVESRLIENGSYCVPLL